MGSMLIAKGLRPGRPPEEWNRQHPSIVRDVHMSYLQAGSEVLETNTFGGTPSRLRSLGLDAVAGELNTAGVELARDAISEFERDTASRAPCDRPVEGRVRQSRARYVAVSLGPTGKMLPPVGGATETQIRDEFAAQIKGIGAGYDLFVFETMYDLREALIALAAARELSTSPVAVTLTFNRNPRGFFTIMGNEATRAVRELEDAGADVVGANCTITSAEMTELGRILRKSTDLPILCQPNAGKPQVRSGVPVYDQTPEDFARDALLLFEIGINAVGGCCGTTPAFIREVSIGMSKQ